jgi:hypothetical protein
MAIVGLNAKCLYETQIQKSCVKIIDKQTYRQII